MQCKEVGPSQCSSKKMVPSSRGEIPEELVGSRSSQMVKCPGASLDSASSGCRHLDMTKCLHTSILPSCVKAINSSVGTEPRSWAQNPNWSKVSSAGSVCLGFAKRGETSVAVWIDSIALAWIGKIAHKDMIRVFTCPWDLLRLVAVTWNCSLFLVLSHLCVLFLCCDLRCTTCVGNMVWYSGVVSRCAVGRMRKLLHSGGSASVEEACCALCWKHQGFGVSMLTGLSHCMHSGVSTGLQQRWATEVWQVSFFPRRGQVCLFLMAVLLRWDLKRGLSVGGQGRWMETDPKGDGSEGTVGRRLRPRI